MRTSPHSERRLFGSPWQAWAAVEYLLRSPWRTAWNGFAGWDDEDTDRVGRYNDACRGIPDVRERIPTESRSQPVRSKHIGSLRPYRLDAFLQTEGQTTPSRSAMKLRKRFMLSEKSVGAWRKSR